MRLIDADKLKESIGPIGLLIAFRDPEVKRIKNIIDNQPTAYNIDKIIEQLENERESALAMADESELFLGQLSLLNIIIPLVKGGGQL